MEDAMARGRAFAETLGIAQGLARSQRAVDFGQHGVRKQQAQIQRLIGVATRQGRAAQATGSVATVRAVPSVASPGSGASDRLEGAAPGSAVVSAKHERGVARSSEVASGASSQSPKLKLNWTSPGAGVAGKMHASPFGAEADLSFGTRRALTQVPKLVDVDAGYKEAPRRMPFDTAPGLSGPTSASSPNTSAGRGEARRQASRDPAKAFSATAKPGLQTPAGVTAAIAHMRVARQPAQSTTRLSTAHTAAGPVTRGGAGTANAPSATAGFKRQQDKQGSVLPFAQDSAATNVQPGAAQDTPPSSAPNPGAGPTEGDVYLDGTLLGRWVARTLSAQASRPASGGAGFDLRRGVFPTGTMIGV